MTKTNSTNTVRFTVDFINKKIIGTKASFDKASTGFGPIYEELADKVAKHPDFALVVKEQKQRINRAKRDYNGMDYDFIKEYIEIQPKATTLMAEYESVKKFAKENKMSVYPFVKKWFLGEFDPDKNGFDMAKAKKAISDYRMAKAILNSEIVNKMAADEEQSNSNVVAMSEQKMTA
ncbi:MAG: hypothetical protein IKC24_08920 [Oscillospiraceae bacterium]|nr:hypothetical protein [Oscillospiraceae bacterium]